jgi:hypothetical protein
MSRCGERVGCVACARATIHRCGLVSVGVLRSSGYAPPSKEPHASREEGGFSAEWREFMFACWRTAKSAAAGLSLAFKYVIASQSRQKAGLCVGIATVALVRGWPSFPPPSLARPLQPCCNAVSVLTASVLGVRWLAPAGGVLQLHIASHGDAGTAHFPSPGGGQRGHGRPGVCVCVCVCVSVA